MAWNSRTLGAFALSTAVAATLTATAVHRSSQPAAPNQPTKASHIEAAVSPKADDARRALIRTEMRLARYDAAHQRLMATLAGEDSLAEASDRIAATWTSTSADVRAHLAAYSLQIANDAVLSPTFNAELAQLDRTVETTWDLFAASTDNSIATIVDTVEVAQADSALDALDEALVLAANEAALKSTLTLDEAVASANEIAVALADAARGASSVSDSALKAFTGVLAKARQDIHQASETYALNNPQVPTITNVTMEEYELARNDSNMTAPAVRAIEEVSANTNYILQTGRTAFAAQSGEVDAGAGGATPPPPAPAAEMSAEPAPMRSVSATGTTSVGAGAMPQAYNPNDPLNQVHNIYFKDMDTFNAVDMLAKKANMNVVGGPALTGTVNANMTDVPLGRAMEIILEVHGMGMIREGNIIRIVTLEEALATHRVTQIVYLDKAKANDLATTLQNTLSGGINSSLVSIAPNDTTNVLLIAGPPGRVQELVELAQALDIAEPVLPTYTEAIPLNYAEPDDVLGVIESMLTKDVGTAQADPRTRHIIINDVPAVIEQARELIANLDNPVKQVAIESMVVDVVLRDETDLGTNILFNLLNDVNARGVQVGDFGGAGVGFGNTPAVSGQSNSAANSNFNINPAANPLGTPGVGPGGAGAFGTAGTFAIQLLNKDYNLNAAINAAVTSNDAKLLANPVIVTVENKPAQVAITQEFPFQELTQTQEGGNLATTSFKEIGTTLNVTPRVTHDSNIIVDLEAKESTVSGLTATGVPIEEQREAMGTFMVNDGQTVFIGGLRNAQHQKNVSKVPVLGDIPVLGLSFRNTNNLKVNTELMIFLTCHILGERLPDLTPAEQEAYDELGATPIVPETAQETLRSVVKPNEMRDPAWKWRKSK